MNAPRVRRGGDPSRPDLDPPPEVVRIARRLEEAGFSTWAVGGAVRDALGGHRGARGDWDLTTAARPGQVQRLFPRTVPVGVAHGTVGVLGKDGTLYEVTTFRRDVETDGRHAKVSFSDTVEEDLQRRDFTINAVAWHPLTHELRDPHGGLRDLHARTLRTVGEPRERFREDRLRVLRALRFAGRFGLRIESDTWEAARESAPELPNLSAERVREELMKVFREVERPSDSLRLYAGCGALASLYPELQACVGVDDGGEDVWTHLLRTVDALPREKDALRFAALLHDVGKPATRDEDGGFPGHAAAGAALAWEVTRRLKFSNAERDRAVHLVAQHEELPPPGAPDPEVRRWLRRVGRGYVRDLLALEVANARGRASPDEERLRAAAALRRRADALLREGVALETGDLAIGGNDLRALGVPPGPAMGEVLRDLLEAVTDDPALNTPEALGGIVRERLERGDD
ncbi:MAG TPA: CCA tRNA nucleotidyltransferase [Longimicrobium sp.]|nr:CCA tRNA nucleotidyltransferase [Longimicrobium sp.]